MSVAVASAINVLCLGSSRIPPPDNIALWAKVRRRFPQRAELPQPTLPAPCGALLCDQGDILELLAAT